MKKIFALLPMVAAFALTGCGNNDKEEGEGQNLEISQEQAKEKVAELATNGGYEITYKYNDSADEDVPEQTTVGVKENYYWFRTGEQGTMYHLINETQVQIYSWDNEHSSFKADDEPITVPADTYKNLYEVHTLYLYTAFTYDGTEGFHKVKDTTFAGRSATEYRLNVAAYGAAASWTVIIDKETGITLFWGVEARDIQGNSEAASFEVTSFKTGDQVSVPAHN